MGWSTLPIAVRAATLLVLPVVVGACVTSGGGEVADDETGTEGETAALAPRLEIVDASSDIYCDGTERLIGEIRGAEPGEQILLSSPQPVQLTDEQLNATADEDGAYRLTWRCSATEAGQPWELSIEGQDSGRRLGVSFTGTGIDPDAVSTLQITLDEGTFVCDGRTKTLGELSNATEFEPVTFAADRADQLVDGSADADGRLTLRWQCSPDEAGRWQVTARGLQSERVGEFTIVGVAPPPEEIPTPTVQVDEDPFLCDGRTRVFATLSGFLPGESVDFATPDAIALREGQADGSGELAVRWTCGAADAGTVWELTAAGARSRRTVSFTLTGAAAPPAPDPTVTLTEDPFQCDGRTRFAATISGFTPREFVDFSSPQAENLRQGQADETGTLQVRWTCGADDADQVWDLVATGASSQLSASFQITAAAPEG